MRVSFCAAVLVVLITIPSNSGIARMETYTEHTLVRPVLSPDAALAETARETVAEAAGKVVIPSESKPSPPVRISIPSIGVNSRVVSVGVNAAGEMDVPDGATQNVGWYTYGTVPGEIGSAVMDAHVYAAFKNLKSLQVGDRIYVADTSGTVREFSVIKSVVYALTNVPMEGIFTDARGKFLNLITCEGRYHAAKGTYSHRRVVYAKLIE